MTCTRSDIPASLNQRCAICHGSKSTHQLQIIPSGFLCLFPQCPVTRSQRLNPAIFTQRIGRGFNPYGSEGPDATDETNDSSAPNHIQHAPAADEPRGQGQTISTRDSTPSTWPIPTLRWLAEGLDTSTPQIPEARSSNNIENVVVREGRRSYTGLADPTHEHTESTCRTPNFVHQDRG